MFKKNLFLQKTIGINMKPDGNRTTVLQSTESRKVIGSSAGIAVGRHSGG